VSLKTMPPSTLSAVSSHAGILAHGVEHLARLEGGGLQRGAGDVALVDEARQAGDDPARVAAPVGGVQAGEGGHEIDAAVVLDGVRQFLDLGG
jgi:hypothetical protein